MLVGMSTTSRTYLLIEERLDSTLADFVDRARASGDSWNTIARNLLAATSVSVTSETLRMWFPNAAKANAS